MLLWKLLLIAAVASAVAGQTCHPKFILPNTLQGTHHLTQIRFPCPHSPTTNPLRPSPTNSLPVSSRATLRLSSVHSLSFSHVFLRTSKLRIDKLPVVGCNWKWQFGDQDREHQYGVEIGWSSFYPAFEEWSVQLDQGCGYCGKSGNHCLVPHRSPKHSRFHPIRPSYSGHQSRILIKLWFLGSTCTDIHWQGTVLTKNQHRLNSYSANCVSRLPHQQLRLWGGAGQLEIRWWQ